MSLAYADVENLSYAQATAEIRQHFADQWPARSGGDGVVRIAWQNGPKLDPPPNPKAGECYVEFGVYYTGAKRTTRNTRRSTGRILAKVFVPPRKGTGLAEGYVDQMSDLWRTARVNGLHGAILLDATRPVPMGNEVSMPYWSLGAMTPFTIMYSD